jgi:transposase
MEDAPRLRRPDRAQILLEPRDLEQLVAPNHQVRVVWAVVERLDLSFYYARLAARGSQPGRSATDPGLLVALWLYATIEGVGGGRELARLCQSHDAYKWLCGGVSVNYHTLNDFRVAHEAELDGLFTEVLASLVHCGAVKVGRITQDGMRVRASAGMGSLGTQSSLEALQKKMEAHVQALKTETDVRDSCRKSRQQAAAQRAAEARAARVGAALRALEEIEAGKARHKEKASKRQPARASTTDPESRLMRMPEGSFGLGYNVQLAADVRSRAILGVDVTNKGSDVNQSEPMRCQVEERTGCKVREHLMDGGFVNLRSIERAEKSGVRVYAPVRRSKGGGARHATRSGDGPGVARWRRRMSRPSAQAIYRQRASTSETINGDLKEHRGLRRVRVRGLRRVRCLALWGALAYNVMHFASYLIG